MQPVLYALSPFVYTQAQEKVSKEKILSAMSFVAQTQKYPARIPCNRIWVPKDPEKNAFHKKAHSCKTVCLQELQPMNATEEEENGINNVKWSD